MGLEKKGIGHMELQVLVATMNQTDSSLIEKMHITTSALVGNQCGFCSIEEYNINNKKIIYYNFPERGVGLNRNNTLMRATGDICLLSDDDVEYVDDYEAIVLKNFEEHPKADVIVFNIHDPKGGRYICKKTHKVNWFNCGKYGAVRVAFRRSKVIKNAISFNLLFGGGARYSAGEDCLFVRECIKKGLKVIAVPDYILTLQDTRESTWFNGYSEKFVYDLGVSYQAHFNKLAPIFIVLQLIRRRSWWIKIGFIKAVKIAFKGRKEFNDM